MFKINETIDRRVMLSTIWIFFTINILYADVLTLMFEMASSAQNTANEVGTFLLTENMLLGAAILLETAFAMIILSRTLTIQVNRWANTLVALLHIAAVAGSLFVAEATSFYKFFAAIEIATLCYVIYCAWHLTPPTTNNDSTAVITTDK